jgi:short-subunit dehydrogenase
MAEHGSGQILNVASVAAFQPGPWMSSYYASKAYVLNFSEGLREELRSRGVRVSVLCPGPTRSAFFRAAQMDVTRIAGSKLMMSAEEVALITVRALEKNRAIIIPGWRNRLLALSPRLAPRWLVRKLSGRLTRPFTGA